MCQDCRGGITAWEEDFGPEYPENEPVPVVYQDPESGATR